MISLGIECPPGMVYQQCGSLCPQNCDNTNITNCHGGCAEGCFCPDGLVTSNGRCIDPVACPGNCEYTCMHLQIYLRTYVTGFVKEVLYTIMKS